MSRRKILHSTLRVIVPMVMLLALPRLCAADEDGDNAKAEASGQRAHFAQEFCGDTPDEIAQYKAKLKQALPQATQFDTRWQSGWKRGDNDALQMRSLQTGSPSEFASRVKVNCNRIKWQAENSLRVRAAR